MKDMSSKMLPKIHISYVPGSMGDYLTGVLMASYFNAMPKLEITKNGRCIIKDNNFSKHFKTAPVPKNKIKDINQKKFLRKIDKSILFSNCHYLRYIPTIEDCWFKKQWLFDDPIIIRFDIEQIETIVKAFSVKNPNQVQIQYKDIERAYHIVERLIFEYDVFYVDMQDIIFNIDLVIDKISKYKQIDLTFNDHVKTLQESYARKNSHLFYTRN